MNQAVVRHTIHLVNTGDTFTCRPDVDVLRAMEQLNFKGIPVGCRGGGCGVCKVHVVSGEYQTRKMSRSYVSAEEEAAGTVLACRLYPRGDLELEVVGGMRKCLTRKLPRAAAGAASCLADLGRAPP
ncbi:2Fe-2S iron-sulfur cluster binding domain-containing protein [Nitrogeniibacter mangrovi]|uniref:2Fe-2S iron-sulfur cluster binding domain-containing protein n=1 Tax=Nitrogeniibacter mangrovi TaxID=2016596 RepID=A0A6C1B235_9RHOO|nr:2Fe-2S iron-sulfur cluster binding domain-containing protein [Nitrogeniibacter mangrovi]QID17627.1 2Fe-2S iron-sulfur cluster binding domain-containing protein [Nitrogeniibacter mangrovi]